MSRVGAFCVNSIKSPQPFRDTHHISPTGPVEDLASRLNGDSGNNECPNQEYCLQTFPWICCDSIVPAIAQSTWNQVGDLKPRSDSLSPATV